MLRTLFNAALALALVFAVQPAIAQAGSKAVRLVVPTPPGGASDTAARTLAPALAKGLGQPVIVENRPGAGGALAAQAVMTAAPDGQTLLWGLASMAGLPALQKTPPFKSMTELVPVAMVGRFAFGLFVHPDVPARTVAELITYGRANPDKLNYATGTLGEYMAMVQLLAATGISSLRVPYKGGVQLMPDLMTGRIQLNIGPVSSGLQHVKDGKLRMLAVLLPSRIGIAPDVPTLAESGVPISGLPTWQAIFAPPGTPPVVAERVNREVARALADPELRGKLEQQALQVQSGTREDLAKVVAQDEEVWRVFVRENNVPRE
ncbi:MAG: tripartite tricarboxylate transporter substrate binding protein [Burkholderiaceae bacterium]